MRRRQPARGPVSLGPPYGRGHGHGHGYGNWQGHGHGLGYGRGRVGAIAARVMP